MRTLFLIFIAFILSGCAIYEGLREAGNDFNEAGDNPYAVPCKK